MILGVVLPKLMRKLCLGEGQAGDCRLGRMREMGRGARKKITGAPSWSGPRLTPAGLGKRTKQRMRESSPVKERVRSLQPAVWGDLQFTLKSWVSAPNDLGGIER